MELRDTTMTQHYEALLKKLEIEKQSTTRCGAVLVMRTNFTCQNQVQVITHSGTHYININQLVFGDLRPYLKEVQPKVYEAIDWEQAAYNILTEQN